MKSSKVWLITSKVIHWMLVVVLLIYLVTGLDIEYYQAMQVVTFGLLSKLLATKIHDALLVPFVVLIIAHIVMVSIGGRWRKQKRAL
jgi:thiosulfate reductase cytochrome b subunit